MHTLFTSKVRAGVVAGALALGFVVAAVPAQAEDVEMTATIPFAFDGGGQHFDSGKYVVTESSGVFLTLANQTTGKTAVVMTHSEQTLGPSRNSKLVFHRVNDHYYLKQVWTRGDSLGRGLPTTRSEKEALIARTDAPSSNVTLALNRIPR